MRTIATILLLTLTLVSFTVPVNKKVKSGWVIDKSSSMSIEGSSNINSFTCDLKEYLKPDTLLYSRDEQIKKLIFRNSELKIDISRFDCHHKYITADFRKILRSEKNPCLKITFISLDDILIDGNIRGVVDIEIAGQTKRMDISYAVRQFGDSQLKLTGSKLMSFSDFRLTAPRKLMGLIQINEGIKVNFNLHFRRIS